MPFAYGKYSIWVCPGLMIDLLGPHAADVSHLFILGSPQKWKCSYLTLGIHSVVLVPLMYSDPIKSVTSLELLYVFFPCSLCFPSFLHLKAVFGLMFFQFHKWVATCRKHIPMHRYTHFSSQHHPKIMTGVVKCLRRRAEMICSQCYSSEFSSSVWQRQLRRIMAALTVWSQEHLTNVTRTTQWRI